MTDPLTPPDSPNVEIDTEGSPEVINGVLMTHARQTGKSQMLLQMMREQEARTQRDIDEICAAPSRKQQIVRAVADVFTEGLNHPFRQTKPVPTGRNARSEIESQRRLTEALHRREARRQKRLRQMSNKKY